MRFSYEPTYAIHYLHEDPFQSLCTKADNWEDKLEGKALTRLHSLVNDLRALKGVRVPRVLCY